MPTPVIHRYEATYGTFYCNVFLVETPNSVIAIDSAISIPDVQNIRSMINDQIKKPLKAVLLTHGHPDHYTGAIELVRGFGDIPVVATQGVRNQCETRDAEESSYLGSEQAFGAAYPKTRLFPNSIVSDGAVQVYDDVAFTLRDLGPCESDDDCFWTIGVGDVQHVFSGDIVYNQMHTFFRDGHTTNWLRRIDECIATYDSSTVFHTGHGNDMGIEMFYWKKGYILAFVRVLGDMLAGRPTLPAAERDALVTRMRSYVPNDKLMFLTSWQFDDAVRVMRQDGILK